MILVCYALSIYWVILVVRIILSWVTMFSTLPDALGGAAEVVFRLTEPVLGFARRYIPPFGMLDISPIVVFLVLGAVQAALC